MFTVIFDDGIEDELCQIRDDYERIEDLKNAIKWGLERNPNRFESQDDGWFIWKTGQLIDDLFPKLKILYSVHEQTVRICAIAEYD